MASSPTEAEFKAVLRNRMRRAREGTGYTKDQLARLLGVEMETYKKWEGRESSAIRIDLVERFCLLVRIDIRDFLGPPSSKEIQSARSGRPRRSA